MCLPCLPRSRLSKIVLSLRRTLRPHRRPVSARPVAEQTEASAAEGVNGPQVLVMAVATVRANGERGLIHIYKPVSTASFNLAFILITIAIPSTLLDHRLQPLKLHSFVYLVLYLSSLRISLQTGNNSPPLHRGPRVARSLPSQSNESVRS